MKRLLLLVMLIAPFSISACTSSKKVVAENTRIPASEEPKSFKIQIEGELWGYTGGGSLVMKMPFVKQIKMQKQSGDWNNAVIGEQATGMYKIAIDELGYTVDGKPLGASRCIGSSDIALNIEVRSYTQAIGNKSQKLFSLKTFFSSVTQDTTNIGNGEGISLARYPQAELINLPERDGNLLTSGSMRLTSSLMKVLKQLPGCHHEIKEINSSLTISRILVVQ